MPNTPCPLCLGTETARFFADKQRDYLRCRHCQLVFVPPPWHLSAEAEQAVYDLHQNRLDDAGYRQFLSRLAEPLLERLPASANGLDYGCGPGPLLARMFNEHGHVMRVFDPIYANRPDTLQNRYDFVTCTEVVEHFRQPRREFQRLFGLLKPKGHLGIMTKLVLDADAFSRWHYKNDPTHIGFYSADTMAWLAESYRCRLEFIGKDVIIFTPSDAAIGNFIGYQHRSGCK
ncbi:class I SAM-dependent methyltransferase [Methylomonas sp. SURF-2]|uniref:Class I SAM-dependent methyltransferase n=1 Tax=Methylomonas subterranea TaxID=2952225 RepID=A0ABT1TJS2_9GAMM|nr:class I SAM-dependent methyltransferase [Methylomonas sp. SURF-2]MCQ8105727.1 class I SAM-dependent methyltransferase [Methylomonas sp. SURF-2]